MLQEYIAHKESREKDGLPPLPLNVDQTVGLVELLKNPPPDSGEEILNLLTFRVPSGVDDASKVKAQFLFSIAKGEAGSPLINRNRAVFLLGTMGGGYNVQPLIELLDIPETQEEAARVLGKTILVYDGWKDILAKAKTNKFARQVLKLWAEGLWFSSKKPLSEKLTLVVFKVSGEINTDDFSPASEAWSRPDIPLHALSMLANRVPGGLDKLNKLKGKDLPLAFVGDVVGTGSSRKSAINSLLWHIGDDISYMPNKRSGGVIIGGKIAPIFFNTAEDSGALPLECDVGKIRDGEIIHIYPYQGKIEDDNRNLLSEFELKPVTLTDEIRAGGRIPLIIGRALTDKTREYLKLPVSDVFIRHGACGGKRRNYTLAQKMVGRACGVAGISPGTYCEPLISSVGSQDTTGGMTRDELKELACLGFSADLVMQSFCHTAAYPKPVDIRLQQELPGFFQQRGGIALRPGDGIIHSWLNRMILPDTVGTGGDSHTRFPIGISFPAGSGLVAFAATLGVMPLDMPQSVLVRFSGEMQPGITLRDMVNAIPYTAIKQGLLTVAKENKKNIFSGRIMEIEGLPELKVEQAFELSDASAERSAAACTVLLAKEPVAEYLRSNIALLNSMIAEGYEDKTTIRRRIEAMENWLDNQELLEPDKDAEYAAVLEVNMNEITEPLLACPNDPDDIKPLSEVTGTKIDEVFIGSCMTNIGHYRAAAKILAGRRNIPTRLWIAPPTRMDEQKLVEEGVYAIFGQAGARTEMPGCSLCMGNQARVGDKTLVFSTSTRNFPNRLGKDSKVFLGSAELAAVCAADGEIPSVSKYLEQVAALAENRRDIYRFLQFDAA